MLVEDKGHAKRGVSSHGPDLLTLYDTNSRPDLLNKFDVKNSPYLSTGNVDSAMLETPDACPGKGFSELLKGRAYCNCLILYRYVAYLLNIHKLL